MDHAAHETSPEYTERPGLRAAGHAMRRLATMHPAYFAMAMATGIVAIGARLLGLDELAAALSWLNLVAYPALWILLALRIALFPREVLRDFTNHQRAPGFFTVVAATGVVGVQAVLIHNNPGLALFLWCLCVGLWAACTYSVFTVLTVCDNKPDLASGINGGWLVTVVATQSVCVLGCVLGGLPIGSRDAWLFLLMSFWLCGGMLYFWIIAIIFYRYMFFSFSPRDLLPPYWINMGAVAISTLGGALLAMAAQDSTLLAPLRPFILGLTLMFWATATWWIPMLLILGFWRHYVMGVRIAYDPLYWSLVFPLGMYAVCTFRLAQVLEVPSLLWISRIFITAAASVWLLTFLGLARRLLYLTLLGLRSLSGLSTLAHPITSLKTGGTTP